MDQLYGALKNDQQDVVTEYWNAICEKTEQDDQKLFFFNAFHSFRSILTNTIYDQYKNRLNDRVILHSFINLFHTRNLPFLKKQFLKSIADKDDPQIINLREILLLKQQYHQEKLYSIGDFKMVEPLKKKKVKVEKQKGLILHSEFVSKVDELKRLMDDYTLIVLQGPNSGGKSSLVRMLDNRLEMYMDQTIDYTSMLGQFVCSEEIGVFKYEAGNLLKCIQEEKVLVLKNFQDSNEDLMHELGRSVKQGYIRCNNRKYYMSERFKVVCLSSEVSEEQERVHYRMYQGMVSNPRQIMSIRLLGERTEELILEEKYGEVFRKNKELVRSIGRMAGEEDLASKFKTQFRDTIKLMDRFEHHLKGYYTQQESCYLSEKVRSLLFLDIHDILFHASLPQKYLPSLIASVSLPESYLESLTTYYNPKITIDHHYLNSFRLNQIQIKAAASNIVLTQYSSTIIEKILMALIMNEPCLLISETGCGKTTLTQYCAQLLNQKLHVFNLSQGSDAQDLLGGFKPLDYDTLFQINFRKFMKQFTAKVNVQKNQDFIAKVNHLYSKKKYDLLIKCMLQTAQQGNLKCLPNIQNLANKKSISFYHLKGNLVKAMKKGHWVLIDEINLANYELLQQLLPCFSQEQSSSFRLIGCMNPMGIGKKDLPANIKCRFTSIRLREMVDKNDLVHFIRQHGCPEAEQIAEFYLEVKARMNCSLRNLSRALNYYKESRRRKVDLHDALQLAFDGLSIYELPAPSLNYKVADSYVEYYGYQIKKGPLTPVAPEQCEYMITKGNFKSLISALRCLSGTGLPMLLEGPTSGGKTSLVYFLGAITGHRCHRINNHQNTEVEEYLGHYVQEGNKFVFKEGLLVKACREGDWVILDELNLAKSEILENLNRLLDDNQELFLPETQTVLKPHPHFRVFGTQNPSTYSGRKELSKAFRNRFIEVQFDEISREDSHEILLKRCIYIAPSHVPLMLEVQKEMNYWDVYQKIRLRDLIKWGQRMRWNNTKESCALEGYCLLGERMRDAKHRSKVRELLERVFKLKLTLDYAHDLRRTDINWNTSFSRMVALCLKCIQNHEPILLIGYPGVGKSKVVQVLAEHLHVPHRTLVCHQYLEISDFVGSVRSVKNTFQWQDGPLLQSIKQGALFFLDEINMCPESVLEGLNSVFEIPCSLTVNETLYHQKTGFHIIAAMNPGGDWGKKELSPALRSRFTEIYIDNPLETDQLQAILTQYIPQHATPLSTVIQLYNQMSNPLTFRDLILMTQSQHNPLADILDLCIMQQLEYDDNLYRQVSQAINFTPNTNEEMVYTNGHLTIGNYSLPLESFQHDLIFNQVHIQNMKKLIRAICIPKKPILIEGPIAAGKQEFINLLANSRKQKIVCIILDEQSDMQELLGCEQPNSQGGFQFVNGLLLNAILEGWWVILKNLNMAPQQILEGLNSILDDRHEIYIPELDQVYKVHPNSRIFGVQNSAKLGGGRKWLPNSFMNRFIKIYFKMDESLGDLRQKKLDALVARCKQGLGLASENQPGLYVQQQEEFGDLVRLSEHINRFFVMGQQNIGKKHLIERLARYKGKKVKRIKLNKTTDSMDLQGYYEHIKEEQFEWKKSELVVAAEKEEWILIEDVDKCNQVIIPKLIMFMYEHPASHFFITSCSANSIAQHCINIHLRIAEDPWFRLNYHADVRKVVESIFISWPQRVQEQVFISLEQEACLPQQMVRYQLQDLVLSLESQYFNGEISVESFSLPHEGVDPMVLLKQSLFEGQFNDAPLPHLSLYLSADEVSIGSVFQSYQSAVQVNFINLSTKHRSVLTKVQPIAGNTDLLLYQCLLVSDITSSMKDKSRLSKLSFQVQHLNGALTLPLLSNPILPHFNQLEQYPLYAFAFNLVSNQEHTLEPMTDEASVLRCYRKHILNIQHFQPTLYTSNQLYSHLQYAHRVPIEYPYETYFLPLIQAQIDYLALNIILILLMSPNPAQPLIAKVTSHLTNPHLYIPQSQFEAVILLKTLTTIYKPNYTLSQTITILYQQLLIAKLSSIQFILYQISTLLYLLHTYASVRKSGKPTFNHHHHLAQVTSLTPREVLHSLATLFQDHSILQADQILHDHYSRLITHQRHLIHSTIERNHQKYHVYLPAPQSMIDQLRFYQDELSKIKVNHRDPTEFLEQNESLVAKLVGSEQDAPTFQRLATSLIHNTYSKYWLEFKDVLLPLYASLLSPDVDPLEIRSGTMQNDTFKGELELCRDAEQILDCATKYLLDQQQRDLLKMDDAKMHHLLSEKMQQMIVDEYEDKTKEEIKESVSEELTTLDINSREFLRYCVQNQKKYYILKKFEFKPNCEFHPSNEMLLELSLVQPSTLKQKQQLNVYKHSQTWLGYHFQNTLMTILQDLRSLGENILFLENEVLLAMEQQVSNNLNEFCFGWPIIKVIDAMQGILNKTEEWNKTVPKQYHLLNSDLERLLILTRRWERDGWKYVLLNKIEELWAVEMIIVLKITPKQTQKYLEESLVGTFELRMVLAELFLQKQSVWKYSVFMKRYNETMKGEVSMFEKELNEYRQLASWDSKNHHMLQDQSTKIRIKLGKVQSRFRTFLNDKFAQLKSTEVDSYVYDSHELYLEKQTEKKQRSVHFASKWVPVKRKSKNENLSNHTDKATWVFSYSAIRDAFERIEQLKETKSNVKMRSLQQYQEYLQSQIGLIPKNYQRPKLLSGTHPRLENCAVTFYMALWQVEALCQSKQFQIEQSFVQKGILLLSDFLRKVHLIYKKLDAILQKELPIEQKSFNRHSDPLSKYLKAFKANALTEENYLSYVQDKLYLQEDLLRAIQTHQSQVKQDLPLEENGVPFEEKKLQTIISKYQKSLRQLSEEDEETQFKLIQIELKLLNSLSKKKLNDSVIAMVVANLKSLTKMLFFTSVVFRNVFTKGFCAKDEDENEGGEEGETFKAGTGIGEGKGEQNVTKEIENEEQLVGERGNQEEKPEDEEEEKKEDKGDEFEMENDFDAKAQGKDEPEEEDEDEKQNEDDNLDDDFSSVNDENNEDIKMWNNDDEEEEEEKENEDKKNRKKSDMSFHGEDQKDEKQLKAKEENKKEKPKDQKRNLKEFQETEAQPDSQLSEEEEDENNEDDEELDEKDFGGKGGQQLEELSENNQDLEGSQEQDENISMDEEENQGEEPEIMEEEIKVDENQGGDQDQEENNPDLKELERKSEQAEEQGEEDEENQKIGGEEEKKYENDDVLGNENEKGENQLGNQEKEDGEKEDELNQKGTKESGKGEMELEQEEEEKEQKEDENEQVVQSGQHNFDEKQMEKFKKDLKVRRGQDQDKKKSEQQYQVKDDQQMNEEDMITNLPTSQRQKDQLIKQDQLNDDNQQDQQNQQQANKQAQGEQQNVDYKFMEIENAIVKQQFDYEMPEYNNEIQIEDKYQQDQSVKETSKVEDKIMQSSYQLAEELKTILKANQISALKGDFRTGKRLNMKKLIPYIASNYRKDKIWLRRIEPEKRIYQILLALDDSLSMSENKVGQVALESLASLSLALQKMEAGQIAIASIQDGMTLINPFRVQFTTQILSHFNFIYENKTSSDLSLVKFLSQSQDYFEEETENLQQEMNQLCFIISDGRFNKKLVKPVLDKAEEKKILYILIIIDKKDEKQSITNIKSTSYVKKDGKTSIEIKGYMDDFPFKYFVIIKDIEELNKVLVNILRQYYELSQM